MTATAASLVVFYSFEGNCRELGGRMAEALGADVAEIFPRTEIPRGAVGKYVAGGTASLFRQTVPVQPLPVAVQDYGLVIVGTPVWAWNLPPATRSFLAGQDWTGVRTGLFAMHRGGAGMALASMRTLITAGGGTVIGTADFRDLRSRGAADTRQRAVAWALSLLGAG
ncbi:MAG: hypothetical protein LIP77_10740 [Planctomycetes bacterium]|nr:hypothetical protein [Planctomycetota bacterium]